MTDQMKELLSAGPEMKGLGAAPQSAELNAGGQASHEANVRGGAMYMRGLMTEGVKGGGGLLSGLGPEMGGGEEDAEVMGKFAEMFGAQREIFRKRYLELQRTDLTPAEREAILKVSAQTVDEVVNSKEGLRGPEKLPLTPLQQKVQMEVAITMAAFGAGLNYEDQNLIRVAQMNPEGSSAHDSPIFKLFQLLATGASAEANLEPEQFAQQLAGVDKKEAFAGTQARYRLWVKDESGKEYTGDIPLSFFMDKVDDPELIQKIIVQNWADERIITRPGEEKIPEDWSKDLKTGQPKKHSQGYVPEIGNLINGLLTERLVSSDGTRLSPNEKIVSTNLWHPIMSTRIDVRNMGKNIGRLAASDANDVRNEVIDNLYSHFLAAFTLLRVFGRDRAWDKTLSGRVVDAFRKGISPERYFTQLYGLPPEARGPIFLLTMYWDLWTEKLDKAFPIADKERLKFNSEGDARPLQKVKEEVRRVGGDWYSGWDELGSVAEIQKKVLESKMRREGLAASETWRESLLVMGLATMDADKAVKTYEESITKAVDVGKRKTMIEGFRNYLQEANRTNPYSYNKYANKTAGASPDGYRQWLVEQATEMVYNPKLAMARPGEMRAFSEMAKATWTKSEEVVMKDAEFEGVIYQWGFSERSLADYRAKDKEKNTTRGAEGAKLILRMMSFDNLDYEKWKDTDPRKWHDYLAGAVNTSASMIPATEAVVAKESLKEIQRSSAAQGVVFSEKVTETMLDEYFVNQLKEATGNMRKTFNYFPRGFKAHVGKEFSLVLARMSCKLKEDQWHSVMRRKKTTDGGGWHEFDLDPKLLTVEDQNMLKGLGLQFQGKSVYQRNGYPIVWQARAGQIGLISPELVKRGKFITPLQAMYGSRVLGVKVFEDFIRDIIGDFLFADAEDIEMALQDLKAIADGDKGWERTKMTPEEQKALKAAEGPGVLDDIGKMIAGAS
jgi:hypothetical protein